MFEIFGTRRMSKQFRVRRRHDKACQAAVVRIGQSELCPTLTPGPRVVRPADPPSRWTPRAKLSARTSFAQKSVLHHL
jgi:hypothetical protein